MQLKSETLAKRCEICHQSDCFDPQTSYCSRCAGIPTTVPSRYSSSSSFLDAVNDSRFVQTFGIISLIGALIFFLGKTVGLGVGLTVFLYGKNNYYRTLGVFSIVLSLLLSPIASFWVLSTAIVVKGYDILKLLRVEGTTDPDWQATRSRTLTGIVTGVISFLLSTTIIGVSFLGFAVQKYKRTHYTSNYQSSYQYTGDIETQLFQSIINHDTNKVTILLKVKNIDVNARDKSGSTPLIYASQLGYDDIVQLLCDADANPNRQDINGFSALMYAAMNPKPSTTTLLLEAGANTKLKNKAGYTALDYAKERKNTKVMVLLQQRAAEEP